MIDKNRVLAAFVRAYFEAFSNGIMDGKGLSPEEKQKPCNVKQAMLDYYGNVSTVFHEVILHPIASLNYSFEELEKILSSTSSNTMQVQQLMMIICKTPDLYEAMVIEYKRNFMRLLEGGKYTVAEHLNKYTKAKGEEQPVDNDIAIRSAVAVVMRAYTGGLALVKSTAFRQATVLRVMMSAMSALFYGVVEVETPPKNVSELHSVFMKVCGTAHNVDVMMDEMNALMAEFCH